MTVGERIQQLRNQRGWNQSELARRCGYFREDGETPSQSRISNYESGVRTKLDETDLAKIASALGVSIGQLFGESEIDISPKIIPEVAADVFRALKVTNLKFFSKPDTKYTELNRAIEFSEAYTQAYNSWVDSGLESQDKQEAEAIKISTTQK